MPKKYKSNLPSKPKSTAPASFASSSSDSPKHGASNSLASNSVNDLINRSRLGTNGRTHPETLVSNPSIGHSLPPHIRSILSVPNPPPPKPRAGLRNGLNGRLRRTAGPPAPQSWQSPSTDIPRDFGLKARTWMTRYAPELKVDILPGTSFPPQRSLQDVVFRRMAQQWEWHLENDGIYMSQLPTALKQKLLSYVAAYAHPSHQDPRLGLRVLFPWAKDLEEVYDEESLDEIQDEYPDVTRLDLSSFTGQWLSKNALKKLILYNPQHQEASLSTDSKAKDQDGAGVTAPESWDEVASDEDDLVLTAPAPIAPHMKTPLSARFPMLSHLSLAVVSLDSSLASWSGLLHVAPYLSTLTSLSLANWPIPSIKTSPVGSAIPYANRKFFHESQDNDWSDARSVLRKLSSHLYCLKWLDLSGSADWASALIPGEINLWDDADMDPGFSSPPALASESGPAWNGSWRNIEHIRLAVNWLPRAYTDDDTSSQPGSFTKVQDSPVNRLRQDLHSMGISNSNSTPAFSSSHRPGPLNPFLSTATSTTAEENNRDTFRNLFPRRPGFDLPSVENTPSGPEEWDVEEERDKYRHQKEKVAHADDADHLRRVAKQIQRIRTEAKGKFITFDFGGTGVSATSSR